MPKKVVVIGGGTGTFTVLSGLKKYPFNLTAIVTMSDDGSSSGVLRDELGVLPPGDVRQCLVALSRSPQFLRELMNYRFREGGLRGHSFGNLFISALEKMTGSFDEAVTRASEVLHIEGRVIPSTLNKVSLAAKFSDGEIVRGEDKLAHTNLHGMQKLFLVPRALANPKALRAIAEADAIVIGPGNLFRSLVPNLLARGIPEAIRKSHGKKIFVANLMTQEGHTDGFTLGEYIKTIEQYLGGPMEYVIWNKKMPPAALLKRYARKGEHLVPRGEIVSGHRYIGGNLVSEKIFRPQKWDPISAHRTLIRHDPARLGALIAKLVA